MDTLGSFMHSARTTLEHIDTAAAERRAKVQREEAEAESEWKAQHAFHSRVIMDSREYREIHASLAAITQAVNQHIKGWLNKRWWGFQLDPQNAEALSQHVHISPHH